MTTLAFDELMTKIPTMSMEELNELSDDLKEFKRNKKGKPLKSKYRALIQTSLTTGIHRILFKKVINNEVKIVEKTKPTGSYKVTGYPSLAHAMHNLKGAIPVFYDEQIEWNGQNCELTLFNENDEEIA